MSTLGRLGASASNFKFQYHLIESVCVKSATACKQIRSGVIIPKVHFTPKSRYFADFKTDPNRKFVTLNRIEHSLH